MEPGLSHSHRPVARHCSRQLPSRLASSELDQVRHLYCSSSSHPCPGRRHPEADPVGKAYRPPFRSGARLPVFRHHRIRPAPGDFVQQPRPGQTRVPGRSGIDSRGRIEPDRRGVLPPRPVCGGKPEHLRDDYSGRPRRDSSWRLSHSTTRRRNVSPHLHEL